ncbi:ImmA/IrrE family metallo-endopeptidase [Lactiplantibacillus modestisalitolerans]|uniref:ImmA/IrrE family metallo-endopeptidase n=1 Tax=Lactiplantibacillus modestisalitolerans TaxID=1457219 RepID=A0ABV5WWF5_9LACO|nr:ImmA/IrrE family metallo-endopeptidase [Lactiplantibacillus modestisalitolerans]
MKIDNVVKMIVQRYGTADPFIIADKLNVQVEWSTLGPHPLGKTIYDGHSPIVLLNSRIKHKPIRNFTMGHELGHVILQEDLVGYYTTNRHGHSKLETEADKFSVALMGLLFIEDNNRVPGSYQELAYQYGVPLKG